MVAVLLLLVQGAPPVLQQDGLQFKDLNRNGVLDPYSSMAAVAAQRSDLPHDSRRPLYPFRFGRVLFVVFGAWRFSKIEA